MSPPDAERPPGKGPTETLQQIADLNHDQGEVTATDVEWLAQVRRTRDYNARAYYQGRSPSWWYRQYEKAGVA